MDTVTVNGPEDVLDWDAIDWRTHEENVARLRRRIFKATREQDWARVRSLQKNDAEVVVEHAGQRAAGHPAQRRTSDRRDRRADRLSSKARAEVAVQVHRTRSCLGSAAGATCVYPEGQWKAAPARHSRDHGPVPSGPGPITRWKPSGRPGSNLDRMGSGRAEAAPTRSVPCSPRCRAGKPGECGSWTPICRPRSTRSTTPSLLDALGSFPARDMIRRWLRAGVVEKGQFTPTEQGSPQGGVISPLLMNVALHGLEEAAGVRYRHSGRTAGQTVPNTPIVVRYADDLVTCCYSQQQAEQVKARLAAWLAPRGLVFNEDKTRIVHLADGFDFLGFNVRRYKGGKLLIKPSTAAVRRLRERLTVEMRGLRGSNAAAVIARLNPIIRGWAAYYRGVVSSRIFNALDMHMWRLNYKWANHSHPKKPKKWITKRYFGRFNKFRNDQWVFGDRAHVSDHGDTPHMVKFSWTPIVRHQMVAGGASPDDPDLASYWTKRRRRVKPPLDDYNLRLLARQDGNCPLCGEHLLSADQPPQSPR